MRPELVPENIRDLIPLAERWGISCDVTRHESAENASDNDLREVREALEGRHSQIHDFLYSDDQESRREEIAAFQSLLVFELEECDGPGIPGEVEFWLLKYRESLIAPHRDRLAEAYRRQMESVRDPGDRQLYEPELSEVEAILGIRSAGRH